MPFPCDSHVKAPDEAFFRAIDVDAAPETLFRWLCQLRIAPYSYDLLDNFGRRSPQTLTPGLDSLEVGQRVMTIFELAEFERDRHLTLVLRNPRMLRELAVTYMALPAGEGRSRLLVKLLLAYRGGSIRRWPVRTLLPPGDLVMMRKQLQNLKRLAERTAPGS